MPDANVASVTATTAAAITAGASITTFILGFFASRLTMTRKEKNDVAQANFQNSKELMERQEETYQGYVSAIRGYIDCLDEDGLDHFFNISTLGETYFYQLKIASDAILSGRVDPVARDNTLLPKIREAVSRTLPDHYKTLQEIAKKKGFRYNGHLRRQDYEGIYSLVEKYGGGPEWQ